MGREGMGHIIGLRGPSYESGQSWGLLGKLRCARIMLAQRTKFLKICQTH